MILQPDSLPAAKPTSKVGEKIYEFMQKPQERIEVGEIVEEYSKKYVQEIQDTVNNNLDKYKSPFYIVVLHKKEPWSVNVMRNWFIARQTKPLASVLRHDYPNHSHTVYEVDSTAHKVDVLWNLPTKQDSRTIKKAKDLYDPTLVKWITDFETGRLP